MIKILPLALAAALLAPVVRAQSAASVPRARLLLTVTEIKRGAPPVAPSAFTVHEHGTPWKILGWQRVPAATQLWIALDEDTTPDLNRRLGVLQSFVMHLPADCQVGVAYLALSGVQIASPLSADHQAVAKAIVPVTATAGASPDPYASLKALLDQWPAASGARRELLVLTDGSIHVGGDNDPQNPLIQALVSRALQQGIVVFGLSVAGVGNGLGMATSGQVQPGMRISGGGNVMNSPADTRGMAAAEGQSNLRELARRTGGLWNLVTTPMTVLPDELVQVLECLQRQYYFIVQAPPGTAPGLTPIQVDSKAKGVKISVPSAVVVSQ